MLAPVISGMAIYFLIYFFILQLVWSIGQFYDEKKQAIKTLMEMKVPTKKER